MLPPHTLIVRTFAEFRDFVRAWIEGHYNLMVILGDGGLAKSETIERLMFDAKGGPNKKWAYIKGKITPLKLYEALYNFRLLPIVINDVDTLIKDETIVSLLKCVCDTSKVKSVQWMSSHSAFGCLPRSFDSISPVLVVTNSWEKVNQNITALHNRGIVILFRPSATEIHREVGQGGWFHDQDVWQFIGKNLYLMTRPDLRFYVHARNHKLAGRDWKDLTLRMLEFSLDEEVGQTAQEKEKLVYVARLLADSTFDLMPAAEAKREKAFKSAFGSGGSRATYHRHKRKLQERRGSFDPQEVAEILWRDPEIIPTVYDAKQTERRAILEVERRELELAGGVMGLSLEDEDDD